MGKLGQKTRGKNTRPKNSVVVIGCEGINETETNYFQNFSNRNCRIKYSTGSNTDPIGMAKNLVSYINRNDIKARYGDKIYLLVDTDINQNKQDQIKCAKKICDKHGIELITSTPTFEYWFLLHYKYTAKRYTSSKEVKKEMKKMINGYSEGMNVYPLISKFTNKAIENAKMIEAVHKNNSISIDCEDANPHTSVYKVVEELIKRKN